MRAFALWVFITLTAAFLPQPAICVEKCSLCWGLTLISFGWLIPLEGGADWLWSGMYGENTKLKVVPCQLGKFSLSSAWLCVYPVQKTQHIEIYCGGCSKLYFVKSVLAFTSTWSSYLLQTIFCYMYYCILQHCKITTCNWKLIYLSTETKFCSTSKT